MFSLSPVVRPVPTSTCLQGRRLHFWANVDLSPFQSQYIVRVCRQVHVGLVLHPPTGEGK